VFASPDIVYEGEPHKFHGEIYAITNLISSNCAYPDEAWKFMEWMAGEEAQGMVAVSGMIPSNAQYYGSESYWATEPLNAELAQLAQERYLMPAALDPNIPQMGELSRVMVNAAQEAFITGADVQETLDKAAEEIKVILSQ
jgi:ABC-type glycerol-3-phosphate transport system substrate-binding protein